MLISVLAVLVVLGGSLSTFAKPPIKVTFYGVYYGSGENAAWHSGKIMPVNNNTFGIYSDEALELTTQVWFYFNLGVNDLSSFQIHLKKLSTAYQDSSNNPASYAMYLWDYNGSYTSNQLSIRTQVDVQRTINDDGTTDYVYTWAKQGDVGTRSVFSFILPFQNFMLQSKPMFFEMVSFSVNGETVPVLQYEQDVHQINEAINEDVPLPSAVPSLEEIGGDIVNEGIDLAQSWVQYFTTNFDIAGAMSRVVKPFSDYFLVLPNDGNTAHTTLVVIMLFSLGAVLVVWLINKLKRRQDDA